MTFTITLTIDRRSLTTLLVRSAWAGTAVAVAWLAFAYLLPQDLSATNLWYGRLAVVAFLGRVFTFHVGLALAAATVIAAAARRWRLLAVAALATAATLGPTAYACRPRTPPPAAGPTLRVAAVNLFWQNQDVPAVLRAIDTMHPDVCVFEEYTPAFDAALSPALSAAFPYRCVEPRELGYGLAVYSRLPFAEPPRPAVDDARAQIRVAVRLGTAAVAVYGVHPSAPTHTAKVLKNRHQVLDLIAQLRTEPLPAILAGDWNFTAETPNAIALTRAGLTDAFDLASPGGRGATWPQHAGWRSRAPGVRIDHAYLSPGLTCTRYATGPDDGSDHLPIVAEVALSHG